MRLARWRFTVPLRLRSLLRGGWVERELDEELRFHLECKIDEGIAQGLSPEEARHAALRAMDGLEQRKEEMRDMRRVRWVTDFFADVRYAIRSLRRTPALSTFVVTTIALGIGLTAAPLSMLDALIFRPYPVPHPSGVVTLVGTSRDNAYESFSYREYRDIRDQTRSYEGVVANARLGTVGFSASPDAAPRVRGGMLVSGNFFRVLGVEPQIGRGFRDSEDEVPGRDAVMVLGPDFWRNDFGSDPSVVGRVVRLNGHDFTVIGVAPRTFPGLLIFQRPDFYMPLAMAKVFSTDPQKDFFTDRDDRELTVRARLKPGVTQRRAQSELTVLAQTLEREYPALNRDRGAAVHTQFEMRTRDDDVNWKFGVLCFGLALAVLLVACTNVAGLLLSRAQTRTREIAVRLALGAGRFRLIRLLLTESLVLALLGGLGGIVVGFWAIDFLSNISMPADLPITNPFRMDTRVMLASVAISLVSAVVCGLAPALQSTRTDLVRGLKAGDVDEPGRRRLWGRNALVVAQVSMSLMLLAAAFLMDRGFRENVHAGMGYMTEHVLMARVDPRMVQYDAARTGQFYRGLTERVRALPGVRSVALTEHPPLAFGPFGVLTFVPDGFQMPRDRETFTAAMDTIDEGFFETSGIPILRGRGFLASDSADAPQVAVVNEQFARHYWPDADPVGQIIRLENGSGTPVEIVGVASTIKYRSGVERPTDFVYRPLAQNPLARMVLLVRSSGDPLGMVKPVEDVVHALAPNLPILETRSYEDIYRYNAVDGPGAAISIVGLLGAVGLLLAVTGLYGVVAYNVSRRAHEIGIRMALGARPADVLRLVMSKGFVLVGTGTAVGLALGLAVERLMNAVMFNLGGVDLAAYAIVVPTMFLVTTLATYVPARRAARIAPTVALRDE